MRWWLAIGLAVAAAVLALAVPGMARGDTSLPDAPLLLLDGTQPSIELGTRGTGTLDGTREAPEPGSPTSFRLRIQRHANAVPQWHLEFPQSVLDLVTVQRRGEDGRWQVFEAGDHVPMSRWPEAGRYPSFALQVPHEQPLEVIVRLQHAGGPGVPMRLVSSGYHEQRAKLEYLGLGLAFGALVLLVTGSLWQAWMLHDRSHAWFSAYCLLAMLAAASYTGVSSHLFWGDWPVWADLAPGTLTMLAGAAATVVVRQLTRAAARGRVLSQAHRVVAWLGPVLTAVYLLMPERRAAVALLGTYLAAVALLGLASGASTWWRGDPVGRWIMAGAVPLAMAVVLAVARLLGMADVAWRSEYAIVLAIAWNLPMIRVALDRRLRERRSAQLRQQALASHDPLTGLAKLAPFRARFRRALGRHTATGEPAALVVVSVANLAGIKGSRGAEVAEECLLRTVIKMQKLVSGVDALGRVGDTSFAVVLEGVGTRAEVSEFASRLVASGLMPDPDQPGDPLLQFHVVAALLCEHAAPGVTLIEELLELLGRMSPRTRRPVRYLHPNDPDSRLVDDIARVPNAHRVDRIPEVI